MAPKCMEGKVFSTGQIARLCKCAPRTVSKWIDAGRLPGYRIPGSPDRRVTRDDLLKFLQDQGMPTGELENEGWQKVLVVGAGPFFLAALKELLPEEEYRLTVAVDSFQAGMEAERLLPDVVILDFAIGRGEALTIAENLRRNPHYEHTLLVALANEDERNLESLTAWHFGEAFRKPFDPSLLAECVRSRLEPVS